MALADHVAGCLFNTDPRIVASGSTYLAVRQALLNLGLDDDALHRRGELAEELLLKDGGDLRARTRELDRVVHHDGPFGAAHRFHHGRHIEGDEGPQVEHFGADAVLFELRGGAERFDHPAPVADERHVSAGPLDLGLAGVGSPMIFEIEFALDHGQFGRLG